MSEVKDIVAVNITRETRYPTKLGFGSGAIISEFTPGSLNNPMLGGNRYQVYASTAAMLEDGWAITDMEYRAAVAYFSQSPNPGKFMVGRKDAGDASWTEAFAAINSVYTDWYAFTILVCLVRPIIPEHPVSRGGVLLGIGPKNINTITPC